MLAGLVQLAVAACAKPQSRTAPRARAQLVLAAMVRHEASSPTTTAKVALIATRRTREQPPGAGSVNYAADWIMDVLDDLVGRVDQDIVVEASIDPRAAGGVAESALVEELSAERAASSASARARWWR